MFRNVRIYQVIILICFVLQLNAQEIDVGPEDVNIYEYAGKLVPRNLIDRTSIYFKDVPLEFALNSMREEHGVKISYDKASVPLNKNIVVRMENVFVLEALLGILKNTGVSLQITKGGNLVLSQRSQETSKQKRKIAMAQITGKVIESASGDPLPGANVIIEGTNIGAATNLDGEYIIKQVPPGTYTLKFKYIGYDDLEKIISLKPGGVLEQNVQLSWVAVKGEEVVITAQAEGQLSAINQQLSARTITNVVSADRIQEIPDVNAAESAGRLPGISIIRSGGEGQKLSIRGMAPQYNVMMVNGVRLQSTDREDRSVDLNMISSNLLSGIEVTKALTADMDADAVGGTVNLILSGAEEGWKGNFTLQGGYGSLQNKYDNYKSTFSVGNRFFNSKLGIVINGNAENMYLYGELHIDF
jgi:hypothetical protein